MIGDSRVVATRPARHEIRLGSPMIAREPGRACGAEQGRVRRRGWNREEFVMAIVTLDVDAWAEQPFGHCLIQSVSWEIGGGRGGW